MVSIFFQSTKCSLFRRKSVEPLSKPFVLKGMLQKIVLLSSFTFLLSLHSLGQSFFGEWKTDYLLLDSVQSEFNLKPVKVNQKNRHDYGNHFELKKEGTFRCWYTAPCGNDCFTRSRGTFKLIGEQHIEFFIDTITKHGDCRMTEQHVYPIKAGTFYFEGDSKGIRFIKNNTADLDEAKRIVEYVTAIDSVHEESRKFQGLFEPIVPDEKLVKHPHNIARLYMSSIDETEYELIYAKELSYRNSAIIIDVKGERKYIFCASSFSNGEEFIREIAVYDTELMDGVKESMQAVDLHLRLLERNISYEDHGSTKETLLTYKRGEEIVKASLYQEFSDGGITINYYLKNDTAYFISLHHDFNRNNKRLYSCMEFYLKDSGEYVTKEVARSGEGISRSDVHQCKKYLKRILGEE